MTSLRPQMPAEGILKRENDWNDDVDLLIACSCTEDGHALPVSIEIDLDEDCPEVQVVFYVSASYPSWRSFFHRLKDAFSIVCGKQLTRQHSILLTKQASINFADALVKSVNELDTK
jgi:hypothetical protein|tara:strand:- start:77 stop:427 length:351 start_codon:yes stop_codon:yes gene_type:complete